MNLGPSACKAVTSTTDTQWFLVVASHVALTSVGNVVEKKQTSPFLNPPQNLLRVHCELLRRTVWALDGPTHYEEQQKNSQDQLHESKMKPLNKTQGKLPGCFTIQKIGS